MTYKQQASKPNDRLVNYVSVAERVWEAQAEIIRVETTSPVMMNEHMGFIRATIYMRNDRTATGTSTFRLDLQGNSAKATNPIEDCETSAVGRALAFLGYSADKRQGFSIASREEIEEAIKRSDAVEKKQPTRKDILTRLEALQTSAMAQQVDLTHPLLDIPWEDLGDAELIQLGKYIKSQLEAK
jgi:hypothetical protein